MRYIVILIMVLPLSFLASGQSVTKKKAKWTDLMVHLGSGFEPAFKSNFGLGVVVRENDPVGAGFGSLQSSLNYEIYHFDEGNVDAANLNLALQVLFSRFAMNFTYVTNNDSWQPLFKPEIGLSFFGYGYVSYTYTVGNTEGYFPDDYSRHGIRFGVNIPIIAPVRALFFGKTL